MKLKWLFGWQNTSYQFVQSCLLQTHDKNRCTPVYVAGSNVHIPLIIQIIHWNNIIFLYYVMSIICVFKKVTLHCRLYKTNLLFITWLNLLETIFYEVTSTFLATTRLERYSKLSFGWIEKKIDVIQESSLHQEVS